MSDKRTGELLETYDEIIEDFDRRCGLYEDTKEQVAEIRALIEHGPEVSEEWLRQKAGELSTHRFSNQHPEIAHDWLCRTFREAGVMVKEGK